ncbi:Maf family protein [Thermodesulfobacteriota bacterium]
MPEKVLLLASASPRRRQMLQGMGVRFRAVKSPYREEPHAGAVPPHAYVQEHARGKACAAAGRHANSLIIGADTVVVYRRRILGKPATMQEAREYLRLLNGRTHAVYTGLCLADTAEDTVVTDYAKTLVTFRELTAGEIDLYLARINPLDKAGAYAIQDEGSVIVQRIQGCYYNVVGFPIAKLEEMLLVKGVSLFQYMQ